MKWDVFLVMNGHTNHEVSLLLTDLMYVQAILKKFFIHANLITSTEQMLGISLNSMSINHYSALIKRILMVKRLQAVPNRIQYDQSAHIQIIC